MALLDQLQLASYKGVSFLINNTSTSGGRKDVKHEFPNSTFQTIEDLGPQQRIYQLTAIINEPDYISKRDNLLRVLEEGGLGILVHPFYGQIENIAARTFTLNERLGRLGDTDISITFEVSNSNGLPVESINTINEISQQAETMNSSIISDIALLFNVTTSFSGNFSAASTKLNNVVTSITDNTRAVTASVSKINNFNSLVDAFLTSINSLIGDPDQLGADLDEIFTEIPGLYDTPEEQFAALSLFFDFGDDDVAINETTAGLTERKQNADVINNSVKAFSLGQAYISAADISFTTVEEVDVTANELETAFQAIKDASGIT